MDDILGFIFMFLVMAVPCYTLMRFDWKKEDRVFIWMVSWSFAMVLHMVTPSIVDHYCKPWSQEREIIVSQLNSVSFPKPTRIRITTTGRDYCVAYKHSYAVVGDKKCQPR